MYLAALATQKRVLGERHATVLNTMFHLGTLHMRRADPAHAYPLLHSAATGMKATLGVDHIDWARYSTTLGECLTRLGRYLDAEAALTPAYESAVRTRTPSDPQVRETAAALAALYQVRGDPDAARRWRAKAGP
jgi:tetratricopeptide (TPR) repeat protein